MVARLFFVGEQKGNQSTSKWWHPINFKVKIKHFEMIFAIKNAIFSNKFSCNHYFLLLKVIFMLLTPIQISTGQKNVNNKGGRCRWRATSFPGSSHKREWSTTPSCGKTKDPGNEFGWRDRKLGKQLKLL